MFRCTDCSRSFKQENDLSSHLLSPKHAKHVQQTLNAQKLCCPGCGISFANKNALKRHLSSGVHRTRPQVHCHDCNLDFAGETALEEHLDHQIHLGGDSACSSSSTLPSSETAAAQHEASPILQALSIPTPPPRSSQRNSRPLSLSSPIPSPESATPIPGLTSDKLIKLVTTQDAESPISQKTSASSPTTPQSPRSFDGGWVIVPQPLGKLSTFPNADLRESFSFATEIADSIPTSGMMTRRSEDWIVIGRVALES